VTISRRRGAGVNGSDRVTLTWADGAIKGKWLRVAVLPSDRTGIGAGDVFYFGNLVGETGNSATGAAVSPTDLGLVRQALSAGASKPLTSRFDFNRDGRVNAVDMSLVRSAMRNGGIPLLAAPLGGPAAAPPDDGGGAAGVAGAGSVFGSALISGSSADPVAKASSILDEQRGVLA
jgi:hypothetical protein